MQYKLFVCYKIFYAETTPRRIATVQDKLIIKKSNVRDYAMTSCKSVQYKKCYANPSEQSLSWCGTRNATPTPQSKVHVVTNTTSTLGAKSVWYKKCYTNPSELHNVVVVIIVVVHIFSNGFKLPCCLLIEDIV